MFEREVLAMNEMFKEQIQRLINNPDRLRADPAIRENLISDMRNMLDGKEPSIDLLQSIAGAADLSFRTLLGMYCLSCRIVKEADIIRFIEEDDLDSVLFISTENILKKDGYFYLVSTGRFDEEKKISSETMDRLRRYLLQKGRPIHARILSTGYSFYRPESLEDPICSQSDLQKYIFGALGLKGPLTDGVSILIFNSLNSKDKETFLSWLLETYRKFEVVKPYQEFFVVKVDEDSCALIDSIRFEDMETDSPLKDELISLQDQCFRKRD